MMTFKDAQQKAGKESCPKCSANWRDCIKAEYRDYREVKHGEKLYWFCPCGYGYESLTADANEL